MKKNKKNILSSLLCISVIAQTFVPIYANGVFKGSTSISNNKANIITIDMSSNTRTFEIALSEGSIHKDSPSNQLIKQPTLDGTAQVIAAVNGGFFNSYYKGTPSYPGNYPEIFGTVIKDGNLITGVGKTNSIGITWDGEILIDRVDFAVELGFNNSFNAGTWAVGSYSKHNDAVSLLTSEFPYPVTTEPGSKVFTINNGKITGVSDSGTYAIPANSSLLIYNAGAVAEVSKWGNLPQVGHTVVVSTKAVASNKSDDLEKWNNVKSSVSGGRILIQNGIDVTTDTSYNEYYDSDSKQLSNVVLQRSFAAKMADGSLILGTANASFIDISSYLLSVGAVDAISLDGGASSMLYTTNNGFITSAGRKLATALVVVDESVSNANNKPSKPVLDPNKPSTWAVDSINKAIDQGIIPTHFQNNYRTDINRSDFCVLIVKLIEKKSGKAIDKFVQDKGLSYADAFNDTDDYFIRQCASLNIVSGSNNIFRPMDTITREEAAIILAKTLKSLDINEKGTPKNFKDSNSISSWAKDSVDTVTSLGIMNGVGDKFNPKGLITKEQVFLTMLKILEY